MARETVPEAGVLLVLNPVTHYEKIKRIGEGTYGVVYKARDRRTGEVVALKKVLMDKERNGMPVTTMREIRVLQTCRHDNIVNLKCIATGSKPNSVFMVFEYCAHDLGRLLDTMPRPFSAPEVKCLVKQLLEAVAFLHARWVVHRDLKLSNLLMTADGRLKLCDFGLARHFHAYNDGYTPNIVTLWYRAPEVVLGAELYTEAVDMWAIGCILGELLQHRPLFPGRTEVAQLNLFCDLLGSPHAKIWPGLDALLAASKLSFKQQPFNYIERRFKGVSASGLDLLNQLLTYDPDRRITAARALRHSWFKEHPWAVEPREMPRFPSTQDALDSSSRSRRSEADEDEGRAVKRARAQLDVDQRFGDAFAARPQ